MSDPVIASSVKNYVNNPLVMIEIYISDLIQEWVAFYTYKEGEEMCEIKMMPDPDEIQMKNKIIELGKKRNLIIPFDKIEVDLESDKYARFSC